MKSMKSTLTLSEQVRPLSEVPVPKMNQKGDKRYKVWEGNVAVDGDLLSDWNWMVASGAVTNKKRAVTLNAKGQQTRSNPAKILKEKWDEITAAATKPLSEVGHVEYDKVDRAIFALPDETPISLSALRVRYIQAITGATELRGSEPRKPVVFYKDGKPVALLMPFLTALEVARKAAGTVRA